MRKMLFTIICMSTAFLHASAQNALPDISVKNVNGKIIISWKNGYGEEISNINIQRSVDSLKNFMTFTSVLNPANDENGVVDSKPLNPKMFYRVFIVFQGGSYVFSRSHRPVIDTNTYVVVKPAPVVDSVVTPVKKSIVKKWARCIYTGKDDNVIINLPDALTHKYSIKFYNDADRQIFKIDSVSEVYLILDKVNFIHSGWFHYQLYDNDLPVDKNSFFIAKDIKAP